MNCKQLVSGFGPTSLNAFAPPETKQQLNSEQRLLYKLLPSLTIQLYVFTGFSEKIEEELSGTRTFSFYPESTFSVEQFQLNTFCTKAF
ncbi:hypothetical protein HUJ04_010560 [Dendroctonus ponderosae]|nr:hypothetical protein HUJ04_010560 [Dendroctonus ponderosae]